MSPHGRSGRCIGMTPVGNRCIRPLPENTRGSVSAGFVRFGTLLAFLSRRVCPSPPRIPDLVARAARVFLLQPTRTVLHCFRGALSPAGGRVSLSVRSDSRRLFCPFFFYFFLCPDPPFRPVCGTVDSAARRLRAKSSGTATICMGFKQIVYYYPAAFRL